MACCTQWLTPVVPWHQPSGTTLTELETLAVVWAITHFVPYLYGHVFTAVKAILQTPNPSGKHARWWNASGVRNVKIQYHLNFSLSRSSPVDDSAPQCAPQIATVTTTTSEQSQRALRMSSARTQTCFQLDSEGRASTWRETCQENCLAVPTLCRRGWHPVLCGSKAEAPKESCCPKTSPGADDETYYTGTYIYMAVGWYACLRFVRNCPACSIVSGGGKAPLQPIPVQRPFQIIGVDVMDLIKTGNSHVVVFQQMAYCLCSSLSKVCYLSPVVSWRSNSILWSSGTIALRLWYQFTVLSRERYLSAPWR